MATKNKTAETDINVSDFIYSFVSSEQKIADSFELVKLMSKWTGHKPKMWGPTIIGFGKYHYIYASGHEGDAPLLGFSPRKAEFTLYVTIPGKENKKLLDQLGKYRMTKACIYIKKLADIDVDILEKICKESIEYHKSE